MNTTQNPMIAAPAKQTIGQLDMSRAQNGMLGSMPQAGGIQRQPGAAGGMVPQATANLPGPGTIAIAGSPFGGKGPSGAQAPAQSAANPAAQRLQQLMQATAGRQPTQNEIAMMAALKQQLQTQAVGGNAMPNPQQLRGRESLETVPLSGQTMGQLDQQRLQAGQINAMQR